MFVYRVSVDKKRVVTVVSPGPVLVVDEKSPEILRPLPGESLLELLAGRNMSGKKLKSATKKKRVKSPAPGQKPVGTCPKCDRVFFVPQGMKRHIKFCQGKK